jgi:hypothetical protein
VVAKRTGIRLHAVTVMSDHWHVVSSDPDGRAPDFTRDCHSTIGRHINRSYGDFECLWVNGQSSQVECGAPSDIVGKIAYTLANPVEAGLVRYGRSWPGVRASWPCAPQTIARPVGFFRTERQGGKMPAEAVLEFFRPPGYDDASDEELAELIDQAVADREQKFRDEYDRDGKSFLGRRAVLQQARRSAPRTRAPRFGLSPRVAAKDKWRRIEMLARNRTWLACYRDSRRRWLAGDSGVVFPYGTYKLRLEAAVRCASPPT